MLIDFTSLPGGPIFGIDVNASFLFTSNSPNPKYWATRYGFIHIALKKMI